MSWAQHTLTTSGIDPGYCMPGGARFTRLANKPAGHKQHPPELWCGGMECGDVIIPWSNTRSHGSHGVWRAVLVRSGRASGR